MSVFTGSVQTGLGLLFFQLYIPRPPAFHGLPTGYRSSQKRW